MARGLLRPLTLAALSLACAAPLAAQTVAPDQTGTGGGPASTITAPNTNSLGVTKPPGTSLGTRPTGRSRGGLALGTAPR